MGRFGRLRTTEDLFFHRLGAALTMELTVLDLLGHLQAEAGSDAVRQAYAGRADDAERHVTNVEAAFRLAGQEPTERPCPAIDGLIKDGQAALRKTDRALVDSVTLTAAREVVAYAIATYETLIETAGALGLDDVIVLLRENLGDEQASARIVGELAHSVAVGGGAARMR